MSSGNRKRVVVTGMAGISPLGSDWASVRARHLDVGRNAVCHITEWDDYEGLHSRIGAPVKDFVLPPTYTRKVTRSMGRVAQMAVIATERALQDAGLLDDPLLKNGQLGISYGSSVGTPAAIGDFGRMLHAKTTEGITANTYIKMMAHTAPVNIAVHFGITGRIITTSSACTSGSQGIGYAFEAIQSGRQIVMIAGGAEELDPIDVAVFDTLFATSTANDRPETTPRPFDAARDGLVLGEGAGTLILEEYEHARARGARIHAEIIGWATNCDGAHVTHPQAGTMAEVMRMALQDAGLPADAIGYVNAHGTATAQGDEAESAAMREIFPAGVPVSSLKSYMGHTLGACGALEAWMTIEMMRDGIYASTLNLNQIASACEGLDHIQHSARRLNCEHVMSNNFAFGGINTSLIFRPSKA